jgi:AcrR family transcriptional regulator
MRPEARRVDVLLAAIEQIEQRGVAALRISDVAGALGISSSLVLYHFATKENLVAEAFAAAAESDLIRLKELLARPRSAEERFRAAVRWYSPTGQAKGWRLWIEGWALSLREPVLRQVATAMDTQWRTTLRDVIADGVEAGEFECPDPAAAAWRLTALLDGFAVQLTVHPGVLEPEAAESWLDAAIARELGLGDLPPT